MNKVKTGAVAKQSVEHVMARRSLLYQHLPQKDTEIDRGERWGGEKERGGKRETEIERQRQKGRERENIAKRVMDKALDLRV